MMVAIAVAAWRAYEALTAQQLGQMLMQIATHADPVALRKHPARAQAAQQERLCTRSRGTTSCLYRSGY